MNVRDIKSSREHLLVCRNICLKSGTLCTRLVRKPRARQSRSKVRFEVDHFSSDSPSSSLSLSVSLSLTSVTGEEDRPE